MLRVAVAPLRTKTDGDRPVDCSTTTTTTTTERKREREKEKNERVTNWLTVFVWECHAINEAPSDEYWMRWQSRRLIYAHTLKHANEQRDRDNGPKRMGTSNSSSHRLFKHGRLYVEWYTYRLTGPYILRVSFLRAYIARSTGIIYATAASNGVLTFISFIFI
jgi:hypothetical protein